MRLITDWEKGTRGEGRDRQTNRQTKTERQTDRENGKR